jgi:hypothetical protein
MLNLACSSVTKTPYGRLAHDRRYLVRQRVNGILCTSDPPRHIALGAASQDFHRFRTSTICVYGTGDVAAVKEEKDIIEFSIQQWLKVIPSNTLVVVISGVLATSLSAINAKLHV